MLSLENNEAEDFKVVSQMNVCALVKGSVKDLKLSE